MTRENDNVGAPFVEKTVQRPQVSKVQVDKVASYIGEGRSASAKPLYGGRCFTGKGFFVRPTVFADVSHRRRGPSVPRW